jgi:hypothetical protein
MSAQQGAESTYQGANRVRQPSADFSPVYPCHVAASAKPSTRPA